MKKKILKTLSLIIMTFILFGNIVSAERDENYYNFIIITKSADNVEEIIESENIKSNIIETQDTNVGIIVANLKAYEAEEIEENPNVENVEKNFVFSADTDEEVNPPEEAISSEIPWNLQMLNVDDVAIEPTDSKVKVGIIDSGINMVEDIHVKGSVDFTNQEDSYFMYPDMSGHGTSVAGIIASNKNHGINSGVELYSLKVFDGDTTSLDKIINAIYWAINNELDILNMSFGTNMYSSALEKAINDAYAAGLLLVSSAGNDSDLRYPAAFNNVIASGSIDNNGTVLSQNADLYDNLLLAPGKSIITSGDFNDIRIASGTSMSAPQITGIASLLWQKDLNKSNSHIKNLLFSTANTSINGRKVADLEYANQNFSLVFEDSTTVEPPLVNPNTSELETFDDSTIEALWGYKIHEGFENPDNKFTKNQLNMLKVFSWMPDRSQINFMDLESTNGVKVHEGKEKYEDTYRNYFNKNTTLYLSNGTSFKTSESTIDFTNNALLHGRSNYVASLKFLYTVANKLWTKSYYKEDGIYRRDIIKNAIMASITNSKDKEVNSKTFYGDETYYGKAVVEKGEKNGDFVIEKVKHTSIISGNQQMINLQKMIYLAANCKSEKIKLEFNSEFEHYNFQKEAAIKVLGIAIHLLGDVYAHKTVVPTLKEDETCDVNFIYGKYDKSIHGALGNRIFSGNSGEDFNGNGYWNGRQGIRVSIMGTSSGERGGLLISTAQLGSIWQVNSEPVTTKYVDEIEFLPIRFIYTKVAVNKLLTQFLEKESFSADIFKIEKYVLNGKNYTVNSSNFIRLADLRLLAKKAGEDISNSFLKFYDSKIVMSDIVKKDSNGNEITFSGPKTKTDPIWYGRGFKHSA